MATYHYGQVKRIIEDMEKIGLYLHADGTDDFYNGKIVFAPLMRTREISFYTWGEAARYCKEHRND